MADALKVLLFDIETSPMRAYVWSQKADWIPHNQLLHSSFMLSWAARWEGQKRIHSQVLTPEEAVAQEDARIVAGLAEMMREADVVVAHNADGFDVKVVNARLVKLQQPPLAPVRVIDTLKLARASFRLASNKLDYLAGEFGIPTKLPTNFDLWDRCYRGDEQALKYMVRYNRHDVVVLEQVYQRLKPYVKGLPRLVDGSGDEVSCPSCGSTHMQRRGLHRTNASTFQRWQCQGDGCFRWSRSRLAEPEKRLQLVPV